MSTSSRPFNGDGRTGQADTDSTPVSTPLKPVNPDLDAGSSVPDEPATYPSAAVQQDLSPVVPDRATIVARQRERFGGIKVGSAFFGWLTATGMAVLLIALPRPGSRSVSPRTPAWMRPPNNHRTTPARRRLWGWSEQSPC